MNADIEFARIGPIDREPVDELFLRAALHLPAHPCKKRLPRRDQIDPPGERMARPLDPRAPLRIQPVRRVFHDRFQSHGQLDQRMADRGQRVLRLPRRLHQIAREIGHLRLDAIARFLPAAFIAGVGGGAHGREQGFERTVGSVFIESLQPAIRWQRQRGMPAAASIASPPASS